MAEIPVRDRPRPDYAPRAVRYGSFIVLPVVEGATELRSNVYASETDAKVDLIFRLKPSLTVTSDWSRHLVTGSASLTANQFVRYGSESTVDATIAARGRYDLGRADSIAAGVQFDRQTEARSAVDSPGGTAEPVRFNTASAFLEAVKSFARTRAIARAEVLDYSFDDAKAFGGGVIYQQNRDETVFRGSGRLEYAFRPDTNLFVTLGVNNRAYRNLLRGELTRDSTGWEFAAGASGRLTHLIQGEFRVGFLGQDYRTKLYQSIEGLSVQGRLQYLVTPLTTVGLVFSRSIEDTISLRASGYTASRVALRADHELLRNLIISGEFSYGDNQFNGADRHDQRTMVSLGAVWLVNRRYSVKAEINHFAQDSSGAERGPSFGDTRLLASLVYQF